MRSAATFVSDELEQDLRRTHRITPSAINPWYGSWEGGRLTYQQYRETAAAGVAVEQIETIDVLIKVTPREAWWPTGQKAPYRRIPCPIVGRGRRDGRVKVISPAGHAKLVYPDGKLWQPREQWRRV